MDCLPKFQMKGNLMTSQLTLRSAVCAAALLTAPAAFADVTAAQVWENWKANMALYGEDGITIGDETVSGGTVTVSDMTMVFEDTEATITVALGTMVFEEQGDGTVSVTMADSYPITVDDRGEGNVIKILITQENASIIVGGDPDAMDYAVAADAYTVALDEITGAEEIEGDMSMTISGVVGNYQTDITSGLNTTYDFASDTVEFLVDVKEPGGEGYAVVSGQMADMTTSGSISLPEGADLDDPDTFAADFTFASDSSFGQTGFVFDVDADGEAAAGGFQAAGMVVNAAVSPEGIDYETELNSAVIDVTAAELPFPVNISLATLANTFKMPTSASDEAAPFAYRLAMLDLVVNDELWGMGDPAGVLPRDPASIILDVSGMAKLFFDLMDPAQEQAIATAGMPGELISFAVNEVLVSAVGAEVNASGDFTFDNTDLETFDGLPRPMGELNIGITGANALIDNLISMGLLPQEQATMGRMMMGMFTQPAGDDALTSKIEINEQGHILANGQRIQ